MGLTVPGVDYAWGSKPYDTFKARGIKFAMRYISRDAGKDLTRSEISSLWQRGIKVGVVFETTSGRALAGRAAGHADAQYADERVKDLGLTGIPIYFAVDFDVTPAQKPAVAQYLRGAAEAIGLPRVGIYGGYWAVQYAHDQNVAKWFWQTYAWSGGKIHPATHIYQHENGVKIGGLSCDLNRGRDDIEFGVRGPKPSPAPKPKPRASREPGKKATWRKHLATTNRQLKKLRDRAAKLKKLVARKRH